MAKKVQTMITLVFVFSLMAGISWSEEDNSADFQQQSNLVLKSIKSGNALEAEIALNRLIADFKDNSLMPQTLYKIGKRYAGIGKYEQAKDVYRRLIELYPDNSYAKQAKKGIGGAYILSSVESGQADLVNNMVSTLVADGGEDLAKFLCASAKKYSKSQQYKQAKCLYEAVAINYPGTEYSFDALRNTILINIISEDYDQGLKDVDKLAEKHPRNVRLANSLLSVAERYAIAGKYSEAKSVYEKLIATLPESPEAKKAQSNVCMAEILHLLEEGKADETAVAIDKILADPCQQSNLKLPLYKLAEKCETKKKFEEARSIYEQIVMHYPNEPRTEKARFSEAKCQALYFAAEGNDANVTTAVDQLIAKYKDNPNLAQAIFMVGDEYYLKALFYESKGRTSQANDSFNKAMNIWSRLTEHLPKSNEAISVCYLSARCYESMGEYSKAIEKYMKVAADNPEYLHAWNALFLASRCYDKLAKKGAMEKDEAAGKIQDIYRQLVEKYPDCPAAKIAQRKLTSTKN